MAALLNVFSTRLGRVADRVDLLSAELQREAADTEFLSAQLDRLRRRSPHLDWPSCSQRSAARQPAPLRLGVFLGTLLEQEFRVAVFGFFGAALLCTIIALVLFVIEMLMAGHGLRGVVVRQQQKTADKSQSEYLTPPAPTSYRLMACRAPIATGARLPSRLPGRLMARYPHSAVAVKDLQSGKRVAADYKLDLGRR